MSPANAATATIMPFLEGARAGALPFAPPFLKTGRTVIAQAAAILLYLAPRQAVVPAGASPRS